MKVRHLSVGNFRGIRDLDWPVPDEIPAGAIVVGGLVLLGGVVIGFAGGNGNGDGNATPATAGNQDQ